MCPKSFSHTRVTPKNTSSLESPSIFWTFQPPIRVDGTNFSVERELFVVVAANTTRPVDSLRHLEPVVHGLQRSLLSAR